MDAQVDEVRAFNRFYTGIIGVLQEGLVRTPYTLTEARVIFELAQTETRSGTGAGAEVLALRRSLGLDAGYLSRMLTRFAADGLIDRETAEADSRRRVVRLTGRGREVYALLDRRSADQVGGLLDRLDPADRPRLTAAMRTVRDLLEERPHDGFTLREPEPGDYGWVVGHNGLLYAREYGFDETYEALVAKIVAGFLDGRDPGRERGWIAEAAGRRVGAVFCVKEDEKTARLRLLLVDPAARGLGVGSALVDECLAFAHAAGYREMVLWTNDVLSAARRIYQRAGFELTEEEPHHSFGQDLIGQTWHKPLP